MLLFMNTSSDTCQVALYFHLFLPESTSAPSLDIRICPTVVGADEKQNLIFTQVLFMNTNGLGTICTCTTRPDSWWCSGLTFTGIIESFDITLHQLIRVISTDRLTSYWLSRCAPFGLRTAFALKEKPNKSTGNFAVKVLHFRFIRSLLYKRVDDTMRIK